MKVLVSLTSPYFSWFENLNTLQRGLFYVSFLTCTCVFPHVPTHTNVLYICMGSEHAAPGRVPAPAKVLPAHTHTRVSPPTHSLGAVLHICLQTPWFPLPEKGICIWSDSTCAFLKVKAETPQKVVCTEHRILSCSSALNVTFLFPFFCFCLTVRGASFLTQQLCRKIIIPHFVLRTNCAERFYRVLEVEREGGCSGSTITTGSTEYRQ